MAVATMSAYPNASGSLAPMGVFVPSTPMVVKREKRRRRRNPNGDAAADKVRAKRSRTVRQGFVFEATSHEEEATERSARASAAASTATASSAFAFRVRTSDKAAEVADADAVDAAHASDALAQKQQRAREREQKRQRIAKRKAQMEKDEQLEAALVEGNKLSADQLSLFYTVRDQVKREMRKTMRDFARSAARTDILQLTEKSLEAVKVGVAEFLTENPPSQTMETVPNPENARLKAMIESYDARIKELEKEETQWTTMRTTLDALTPSKETTAASEHKHVELSVTTEIVNLQRAAISEVETTAQRLLVIQDSMKSIDRLALQAEIQKSKLFDAYHGSVFKGYARDPKETLRALLKLAPPSSSH